MLYSKIVEDKYKCDIKQRVRHKRWIIARFFKQNFRSIERYGKKLYLPSHFFVNEDSRDYENVTDLGKSLIGLDLFTISIQNNYVWFLF